MKPEDRKRVIDILARAFEDNPRVMASIRTNRKARNLRLMAEFAYGLVCRYDGVFLSKDRSTIMMYYTAGEYHRGFRDNMRWLWMALRALRLSKIIPTIRREFLVEKLRKDYEDYIYVWILASDPDVRGLSGLADVRDHLFGMSERMQLPILIETTVEKVRKLYHYVGFREYHHWHDAVEAMDVWYLERAV